MDKAKKIPKWPFVVIGIVIVLAAAAVFIAIQITAAGQRSTTQSVVTSASATTGSVSTSASGSGSLAASSIDVAVPVGVTIDDVYVVAGDSVSSGDALASVDSDSISTAISLVETKIGELDEILNNVSGTAQINRTREAYLQSLSQLYALYDDSYIRASATGTIGSVNITIGGTVSTSTGASSGSGSSGAGSSGSSSSSSGSGGAGSFGSSSLVAASISINYAEFSLAALNQLGSTQNETVTATSADGSITISAKAFASDTLSNAKSKCINDVATKRYIAELAEAVCWQTATPANKLEVLVDTSALQLSGGIFVVVLSSKDDPTAAVQTVIVLDDDTASGGGTGGNTGTGGDSTAGTGSSGSTGPNAGGTGSATSTGSTSGLSAGSGSGSGSVGSSGSSGSGSSGSSGSGSTSAADPEISSILAAAFTIESSSQMSVSISLDETDVASIKSGQDATVQCDALDGQTFTGKVSKTSVSDGSYSAIITIDKAEGMYPGFAASATIVKEQVTDAIVLPLAAVQQRGNSLFVYTSATENGELGGEVEISTGLSDESNVEVTSGLAADTTVYYLQQISTGSATATTTGSSGGMSYLNNTMIPNGSGFSSSGPSGSGNARQFSGGAQPAPPSGMGG